MTAMEDKSTARKLGELGAFAVLALLFFGCGVSVGGSGPDDANAMAATTVTQRVTERVTVTPSPTKPLTLRELGITAPPLTTPTSGPIASAVAQSQANKAVKSRTTTTTTHKRKRKRTTTTTTKAKRTCMAGYSPCLPVRSDMNCSEIGQRVVVTGDDPWGLDRDGDGIGCESS